MRERDIVTAQTLSEVLEVSISTIYRDIAHLQGSGIPIEGEAGIGYLLKPGFDLPNLTFTYNQLDALAIGLKYVEQIGEKELAEAAKEARIKIQTSLPISKEKDILKAPYFNMHNKDADLASKMTILRKAIRKRYVISFSYTNGESEKSKRDVQPLALWDLEEGWMVSAWCRLRKDFRTFRLDRISELIFTEEKFEDDETKNLEAFLKQDECRNSV